MASPHSTREMLQLSAFKDELRASLENVLDGAETLQAAAAGRSVVLDRAWILDKMRDRIVRDEYVLEPGAMRAARGLGHLRRLPRELRDSIYGHAAADGSVAIMRASKRTNEEAGESVSEHGAYRLALGFGDRSVNTPLGPSLAKNVRNLNVRVWARTGLVRDLEKDLPTLHLFDGSAVRRRNCVVTIDCDACSGDMDASQVVHHLTAFTGFERVISELDLDWWGEPWPDTMLDFQADQIRRRISDAIDHQRRILEPTLGTGRYYDVDGETHRLVFHPRK